MHLSESQRVDNSLITMDKSELIFCPLSIKCKDNK